MQVSLYANKFVHSHVLCIHNMYVASWIFYVITAKMIKDVRDTKH